MKRAALSVLRVGSVVPVVSLVAFLSIASSADAQMYETVGVRAQGLAGAFVGVADDATATWWNPAGLAGGPYFDLIAALERPDAAPDSRPIAVAIAMPSLGLSYYRLPVSQMQSSGSTAAEGSGRQDEGYLSQFGATFGQSIGPVVIASTVKVLNAHGETHADLDLGAMLTIHRLKAGLSLRNLHETTFASGPDALVLQRAARAGVSVGAAPGGVALLVAADADLNAVTTPLGRQRRVAGGMEAWLFKRVIGVRGGLSAETIQHTSSRSGGASVMVSSGRYLKSYVDAQWTGGSDELRRGWAGQFRLTF